MNDKPLHYDGSVPVEGASSSEQAVNEFKITDEMRKNISGNPFEGTEN
ncbi:hypothetical protein [Mesobacillus harenae]|nr:hypothetical protein [Mesobacillus harenae]